MLPSSSAFWFLLIKLIWGDLFSFTYNGGHCKYIAHLWEPEMSAESASLTLESDYLTATSIASVISVSIIVSFTTVNCGLKKKRRRRSQAKPSPSTHVTYPHLHEEPH